MNKYITIDRSKSEPRLYLFSWDEWSLVVHDIVQMWDGSGNRTKSASKVIAEYLNETGLEEGPALNIGTPMDVVFNLKLDESLKTLGKKIKKAFK